MKLMRSTGLAVALGVVALFSTDAAAQTPQLSVAVNGTVVFAQWTDFRSLGAQGYQIQVGSTPGGSEIGQINLPASITSFAVAAPPNTYYLRVRAYAGHLYSPFSNEEGFTVGGATPPAPCAAPEAPTATANVVAGSVNISWNNVGATAYRVEFSRTPGGTELVQNVSGNTTTFSQYVGMLGTFYARVIAGNACGQSVSAEIPFTVTTLVGGSGPRTPDPAPGTRLPLPGYGAAVVEALAATNNGDLQNSCVEHGGNNVFMFRVLSALRARDSRWGLNWKRGNRGDLSQDIVTYNFGPGADEDTTNVYIIDIIGGHCGNRAYPTWIDQTAVTRNAGTIGRWTLQPYLRAGFPADPRQ